MASSSLHNKNTCSSPVNLCIHSQIAITSATKDPFKSISRTTFLLPIAGFFTLTYTLPVNAAADASTKTKKIAKGKQVFDQTCFYCHQADAIGKPGAAPSLSNKEFLSISSDKFLFETIRDGFIDCCKYNQAKKTATTTH